MKLYETVAASYARTPGKMAKGAPLRAENRGHMTVVTGDQKALEATYLRIRDSGWSDRHGYGYLRTQAGSLKVVEFTHWWKERQEKQIWLALKGR